MQVWGHWGARRGPELVVPAKLAELLSRDKVPPGPCQVGPGQVRRGVLAEVDSFKQKDSLIQLQEMSFCHHGLDGSQLFPKLGFALTSRCSSWLGYDPHESCTRPTTEMVHRPSGDLHSCIMPAREVRGMLQGAVCQLDGPGSGPQTRECRLRVASPARVHSNH